LLIQQTIADFLREGHFWRHLKKMRLCYSERRVWLEEALREQGFDVVPQAGGIQLVMRVSGDDRAWVAKARQAGLAVQALSDWRMVSKGEGGILMSFTNLTSQVLARQVAKQLREAIS
jgi:GntR family transcriptional regulator/MocR family aminotransferase